MHTIKLVVDGIEKSILPKVYRLNCHGESLKSAIIEYHEDLELEYSKGERLTLEIVTSKPKGFSEKDYCGKAFLFSIKEKEKDKSTVYLFSVGGFIIRLETTQKMEGLQVAEEYYFCLKKEA